MSREHPVPWRPHTVFDGMSAHSQAGELPLAYVMQFNADEREWQRQQDRCRELLEEIEACLRRLGCL